MGIEDAIVDDTLASESFSLSETSVFEVPLAGRENIICSVNTSLFMPSEDSVSKKKMMVLTTQVRKGQNV
jgi:hypothetical protein